MRSWARIRAAAASVLWALMLAPAPAAAQFPDRVFVVEDGGRQVSLLDGRPLAPVLRFAPPRAIQGAPQFTADGRFSFFASADGWVTKYDLVQRAVAAQVRAGTQVRSLALSADGRWLLVANASPATLELFDDRLQAVRSYPAATLDGRQLSPASAVHDTGPRRSFVVSFEALPQLWEISYDAAAEPIFDGLVHDYRMGEAIAKPGFLGVRRTPLEAPVDLLLFDRPHRHVLAVTRQPGTGGPAAGPVQVINLDIRRRVAELPVSGSASAPLAAAFMQQGRPLLALATPAASGLAIVDPAGWRVVQTVATTGRSLFVRSHASVPQLWIGSQAEDPAQDATLTLVDRQTLAVTAVLAVPGRSLASLAFSRDGSRALVGLHEASNALLVYDTRTLKLLERLPALVAPVAFPVAGP